MTDMSDLYYLRKPRIGDFQMDQLKAPYDTIWLQKEGVSVIKHFRCMEQ